MFLFVSTGTYWPMCYSENSNSHIIVQQVFSKHVMWFDYFTCDSKSRDYSILLPPWNSVCFTLFRHNFMLVNAKIPLLMYVIRTLFCTTWLSVSVLNSRCFVLSSFRLHRLKLFRLSLILISIFVAKICHLCGWVTWFGFW